MVKPCFHVSSISCFFSCVFVFSFFVNSLVYLPSPRPDQIEILLAFKNEFPILKCNFSELPDSKQMTKSWTSKDVKSFDGVEFDNVTGVVTKLDLYGACLSGTLSANSSLFRFHHLRYLSLSFNSFDSFSFLPELGKLNKLEVLDLSHMGLASEIPSSISSLNRLIELDLSDNELIGSFSPVYNLSRLSSLSLSSNLFSGNIPCYLLTMPFLTILDLGRNYLIDSHETMNCSSSSKLEQLSLRENLLSGRILEPLSKLTKLKKLFLSYQNTTYPINFISLGFKSLELLALSGNGISRLEIGSPNLKMLVLDNCSIKEFPNFIKNLQNLEFLYISNNRLKGEVPKWLWNIPSLETLLLSHNTLDSFEGLPKMLHNSSFRTLDLSNNDFTGPIPSSWAKLRRLQSLDLSRNQLTGEIPQELTTLWFLSYVNMSHNKLTGQIPQCTQFGGQPKSSFEGNINLCALPLQEICFNDNVPSTPAAQEPKPPKKEQLLNKKAAAIGYCPGVFFGLATGQILYSYKPVLFFKLFGL